MHRGLHVRNLGEVVEVFLGGIAAVAVEVEDERRSIARCEDRLAAAQAHRPFGGASEHGVLARRVANEFHQIVRIKAHPLTVEVDVDTRFIPHRQCFGIAKHAADFAEQLEDLVVHAIHLLVGEDVDVGQTAFELGKPRWALRTLTGGPTSGAASAGGAGRLSHS